MNHVSALSLAAILTLAATPSAQAEDMEMIIYYTGNYLTSVWALPISRQGNWATESENLKEEGVFAGSEIVTFKNVDFEACEYDLMMYFSDGTYQCFEGVDVCAANGEFYTDIVAGEDMVAENEAACDRIMQ